MVNNNIQSRLSNHDFPRNIILEMCLYSNSNKNTNYIDAITATCIRCCMHVTVGDNLDPFMVITDSRKNLFHFSNLLGGLFSQC